MWRCDDVYTVCVVCDQRCWGYWLGECTLWSSSSAISSFQTQSSPQTATRWVPSTPVSSLNVDYIACWRHWVQIVVVIVWRLQLAGAVGGSAFNQPVCWSRFRPLFPSLSTSPGGGAASFANAYSFNKKINKIQLIFFLPRFFIFSPDHVVTSVLVDHVMM